MARIEASRLSMGCVYSIVAYGQPAESVKQSLEDALDEVDRLDRLMSHYRPDSPLSRLNRLAANGPVAVDAELFELISLAMTYSTESGGAFDITVGPLMKAWGFFDDVGRVPSPPELARVRAQVGHRHVVLDPRRRTVRFDRPGVELDLGGIAKGYAVDRIVGLLTARGIRSALVDAGGSTMFALSAPPGSTAWNVRVQDPHERGKVAFTVPLRDRALSVSGNSERFFEANAVRYPHIMDPRTGRPAQGVLSVVVLAASGTAGDAIGTTLFVLGATRGAALLGRHPGTEAFFLLPSADTSWTTAHLGGG